MSHEQAATDEDGDRRRESGGEPALEAREAMATLALDEVCRADRHESDQGAAGRCEHHDDETDRAEYNCTDADSASGRAVRGHARDDCEGW